MNRRGFIGSVIASVCALFLPKKLLASSEIEKVRNLKKQASDLTVRYYHMLGQLHDKGKISTQDFVEELGLNYDTEIRRIRSVQ